MDIGLWIEKIRWNSQTFGLSMLGNRLNMTYCSNRYSRYVRLMSSANGSGIGLLGNVLPIHRSPLNFLSQRLDTRM